MRFHLEAFHDRAAGKAVAQDFHRHGSCGRLLAALVDSAHASLGQQADDRDAAKVTPGCQVDDLLPLEAEGISLSGEFARAIVRSPSVRRAACRGIRFQELLLKKKASRGLLLQKD